MFLSQELTKAIFSVSFGQFIDIFWPQPPSTDSANHESEQQASPELVDELKEMASGTGSGAGELAKLIKKFDLCPGHELSLGSPEPDAFCWGRLDPVAGADPRPSWARPQVVFRFCDANPFMRPQSGEGQTLHAAVEALGADILEGMQSRFLCQQLNALYMVLVENRTTFSLLRWDRAGVMVSKKKDVAREPQVLIQLLRRISTLTDEKLGLDPTATPVLPGSPDYELMNGLAQPLPTDMEFAEGTVVEHATADFTPTFKFIREEFARSIEPSPDQELQNSRWRLSIPTSDGEFREFLVGQPFAGNHGFDWRNTRTYIAFDCLTKRFVVLKDSWRHHNVENRDNVESEGEIIAQLNAADVPHVPTVVCHADLELTKTKRYYFDSWGYACVVPRRRHFRMVVQEVGTRLNNVTSSRQIASVLRDCVAAHAAAAKALHLLHGDLKPDNILICPKVDLTTDPARPTVKWEGLLIDWEAFKWLPSAQNGRRPQTFLRSPPWQSISCMVNGVKRFEIADELESFLYIALWAGIRWLRSNCTNVREYMDTLFDFKAVNHGSKPSIWKWHMLMRNQLLLLDGNVLQFHSSPPGAAGSEPDGRRRNRREAPTPFESLLKELLSWCHARIVDTPATWKHVPPVHYFMHCEDAPPAALKKANAARVRRQRDRAALAAKLASHDAVLDLFARKLAEEWPAGDFAGNRYTVAQAAVDKQADEELDKAEPPAAEKEKEADEEEKPKEEVDSEKVEVKKASRKAASKRKVQVEEAQADGLRRSRRIRKQPPLEVDPIDVRPAKRPRRI